MSCSVKNDCLYSWNNSTCVCFNNVIDNLVKQLLNLNIFALSAENPSKNYKTDLMGFLADHGLSMAGDDLITTLHGLGVRCNIFVRMMWSADSSCLLLMRENSYACLPVLLMSGGIKALLDQQVRYLLNFQLNILVIIPLMWVIAELHALTHNSEMVEKYVPGLMSFVCMLS